MNNTTATKPRITRTTWQGRAGTQTIWNLDKKATGLRVVFHQWADEATGTLSVLEGDGWRDPQNFVNHYEVEGVEPDAAETFAIL